VQSKLVLHAVLSPSALTQQLLLERSWDGDKYIWKTGRPWSPNDPIGTGGGYGEILAQIDLTLPDGRVTRALEGRLLNVQLGGGLYFLSIPNGALVGGGRYQLHVRSASGEELRAELTMPVFAPDVPNDVVTFDRLRDTLLLSWPVPAAARAYQVIIDGPYAQTSFFSDTNAVRLIGSLRNVSAEGLPRVFLPGFTQALTIVATDTNYYDYYRSSNHSQTGSGLVNRVVGGIGVFGAIAPVIRHRVRVVKPFDDPVEGTYHFLGSPADSARTLMIGLTLYVESRAATANTPDALSGAFVGRPFVISPFGSVGNGAFLGTRRGDSVTVAFLHNQSLADTIDVFRGRVVGDTLTGSYRGRAGIWRFLKKP
jgi:hypothetical protein